MTQEQPAAALIPIAEAAKSLKSTELNVLMHIKRGLLKGTEAEGGWLIETASLTALVAAGDSSKGAVVCPPSCGKAGGCSSCK